MTCSHFKVLHHLSSHSYRLKPKLNPLTSDCTDCFSVFKMYCIHCNVLLFIFPHCYSSMKTQIVLNGVKGYFWRQPVWVLFFSLSLSPFYTEVSNIIQLSDVAYSLNVTVCSLLCRPLLSQKWIQMYISPATNFYSPAVYTDKKYIILL